ncbi:hypothetical protein C8Q74DRAFT_1219145 [Fomes fomentarius]|nr:hypothetical protein C8Q74DRAFT_1219145 [Fomes fomentarius]
MSSEPRPALYSQVQTVNRCAYCLNGPAQLGRPVKRCRGCALEMYCSRECQRAAWPSHKPHCKAAARSSPAIQLVLDRLGYPTVMSLADALRDWLEIHKHALQIMATISAHLNGGIEHNLQSPERAFVMYVDVREHILGNLNDNPAARFRIENSLIRDKSELPGIPWHEPDEYDIDSSDTDSYSDSDLDLTPGSSSQLVLENGGASATATEDLPAPGPDPDSFGYFSSIAIFQPDGLPGALTCHRLVRLYRTRRADDTALDEETRVALKELWGLVANSTPWDLRPNRSPPVIEETVRVSTRKAGGRGNTGKTARTTWTQRPVKGWNWDCMLAVMARFPEQCPRSAGLRAKELWDIFCRL